MLFMLIAGVGISNILYRNGLLTKEQRESRKENKKEKEVLIKPEQKERVWNISQK